MTHTLHRRRGALIALVLTLLAACRAAPETHDPAEAARIASEVRDWPRAAALWHDLWRRSGYVDAEAAREAARALAETGDRASALALLRSQVARRPEGAAAHSQLGALQLADGETAGAQASFERALALAPGDLNAATGLAQLLRLAGDDAAALATVESARRAGAGVATDGSGRNAAAGSAEGADGTALDGWLEIARASARLQRPGDALDAYERVYRVRRPLPQDAILLAEAVRAHSGSEPSQVRRAVGWLQVARADHPNMSELPRAEARLLLAAGQPGSAIEAARLALELDPGDVECVALLVTALQRVGRGAEAEQALEHGLALDLEPAERARLEALRVVTPPVEAAGEAPGETLRETEGADALDSLGAGA